MSYKVVNGTSYDSRTPDKLIAELEVARRHNKKVRIFLGDTETGRDWLEEYDVYGLVGRSGGSVKVPLLIKSRASVGGPAILDHCIVKLMVDGRVVYCHPKYITPTFQMVQVVDSAGPGYTDVIANGITKARFKTAAEAEKWIAFMLGKRMRPY